MSIFNQISDDIKSAMLARDKVRLEALRNIKKVLIEAKTSQAGLDELPDDMALKAISKITKQGRDSADIYKKQNRPDLYEAEMAQVIVYEEYLPKQMSDEELTAAIKAIISKSGVSSIKDMGKVMGIASKELAGKADGKILADKVKSLLS
jgi:uncharacterized protein